MPDNAAIYIADPSLLGSKLFNQLEDIRSFEGISKGDSATGVRFKLEAAEVVMNFLPEDLLSDHLEGFSGYVEQTVQDHDQLIYVLSRIQHVQLVLGCVITPGFDEDGKVLGFLLQFNSALNGLLFLADSLFDYDGEPVAGPACEA